MAVNITPLMFSVSIEQLDKKLKDWTEKISTFANNGGKGYKLKIDFGDAEGVIKTLKNLKIGDNSEVQRLQKELDGVKRKLDEVNKSASSKRIYDGFTKSFGHAADEMEKSQKRIKDAYADLMKSLQSLQGDRAKSRGMGIDISSSSDVVQSIKSFASEMRRLGDSSKFAGNADSVRSMMRQYMEWLEVIRMLRTEYGNLMRSQQQQSASAAKQKVIDSKSVNEAVYQISVLEGKINSMRALQSAANKMGVTTPNLDKLLKDMEEYQRKFTSIYNNGGRLSDGTTAQMLRSEGGYRALTARMRENTQEVRVNMAARNVAVATISHMAGEEMRLAQAISQSTSALKGQSQVMQDLRSMALQYISVWGAQSFIEDIIEKGGKLEQQRLSIGAILGDTAEASTLFQKVKNLAVKSPFGVTELDAMTKQLSAYGFEYSELYDMTKRLADISAATGTDVNRLALALGHVRSESALTGYTLRQFSMANVPLLQKLADKLGVTTSQIRKMVSKKEISYEDVLDVMKDLTDEGGMFFEAQETMSQALNAKFKNLRDSYEIMFNEIAESSVGDGLKNVAGILTTVSRNWEELFAVVGTGIAVFGGMRAYLALSNYLLGTNAAAVMRGIKSYQMAEVATLNLAKRYRFLTAEEEAMTAATSRWTMSERMAQSWLGKRLGLSRTLTDAQKKRITTTRQQIVFGNSLALTERKQTTEDLARSVALGKVSKAQAREAIILSDLSKVEKAVGIQAVNNVRTYGRWTAVVNGAKIATQQLGAALKSLLFNPVTAIFAASAAVMDLWQRNKEEVDRAKELNDDLFNKAREGIKNIQSMMKDTGMVFKVDGAVVEFGETTKAGKITYTPSAEMDTAGMIAVIDKWTEFIKEYAATPNRILNDAFKDEEGKVRSVAEQYDRLAVSVGKVAEAYIYLKQVSSATEYAENATNGVFDESFITNINDYAQAVKRYDDSITTLIRDHGQSVEKALEAARGESVFASALKKANAEMQKSEKRNLTQSEQLKMLVENQNKYSEAIKAFEEERKSWVNRQGESNALEKIFHGAGGWFDTSWANEGPDAYARQMNKAFMTMDEDATTWANSLKTKLKEVGWDFNNLSESQQQALALAITEMVGKAGDATEEVKERVKKLASQKFGIKLDVQTVEAAVKIDGMKRSLEDLVGHDWTIDIKTATNFNDVISKIRQDYKSAQDYFNNVQPLLIKMGVDVSGGMTELGLMRRNQLVNQWKKDNPGKDATIFENMLADYDTYAKKMNDALGFNTATGISLSDPNAGGKVLRNKNASSTDKELEAWRKRVQLLEKYRQELAQLEKIMTRAQAESKLKSDGDFATLWSYFADPNDFAGSLDFVAKMLGTKGDRKSFVDELGAKKSAEVLRVFKDDVSNVVSELGRMADVMSENYETYRKWLGLTGDEPLASSIAGVAQNSSMSGWLTEKMSEELRKSGNAMSASDIFGLSESEVAKFGKNSPIFKIWDEWQKNEEKIKKQNLDLYAEAIRNAKGYAEKVADINRELEREIEAIKNLTGGNTPTSKQKNDRDVLISNAQKAAQQKIADLTWQNFKTTENWGRVFGNLDKVSTNTLKGLLAKLKEVAPYLDESVEATKAVYEAIEKVEGVLNGRNPFNAIGGALKNYSVLSGYYKQAKKQGDLLANSELAEILGVKIGSTVTKDDIADGMEEEEKQFKDAVQEMVNDLQNLSKGFDMLANMFNSLGMEGLGNAFSDAGGVLSGIAGGAQSLSAFGPWGMAAGAAIGGITSLAQMHDKKRERQIEALRQDVQNIGNTLNTIKSLRERTLGYDNGNLRRSMYEDYASGKYDQTIKVFSKEIQRRSASVSGMVEYYSRGGLAGSAYRQEYEGLKKQREDYLKMYDAEAGKKHSSAAAMEEYKAQIAELDEKIRFYGQDLANELWGIDVKGWADQISDALMTAFENGESAAKAFNDTVRNIMQNVASNIIRLQIIEPMMDKLGKKLFGYVDDDGKKHKGVVTTEEIVDNPQRAAEKLFRATNDFMDAEGNALITAGQILYDKLNSLSGGILDNDKEKSSMSGGITSITEQTADILASYVNAMRADVSLIKEAELDFIQAYWMDYISQVTGISTHIAGIHDNMMTLVRMMQQGDGALYDAIESIDSRLRGVTNGTYQVHVA